MKQPLRKKFWVSLVIFSLMGQVAWVVENMYFNVFLYKMFHATAAQISTMVAASAVAAALTTLLVGALSDRMGKRKLFICGGYLLWGVSILSFALIRMDVLTPIAGGAAAAASLGVSLVIVMDCVMTFFGSSANDACFNAWLTDCGDDSNRGKIEGINAMMPLLAILVVFGGFLPFQLEKPSSWTAIYCIIGVCVMLLGMAGLFLIDDQVAPGTSQRSYWQNVLYSFRPHVIAENLFLYAAVGAFAVFNISIQIFMPYLILYYEKTLGMSDYVLILAPAILLAAAATAFYGKQYDRLGFRTAVTPAVLVLMAGYVLLFFGRQTVPVFLGSLLMMTGYLTGMAVFGAVIKDRIPPDKAGLFQGLRIFGQVLIPGIIGPAVGAAVLRKAQIITNGDGTTSFLPNRTIFLAAFFVAGLLLLVLQMLFAMLRNGHWDLLTLAGDALKAERCTAWTEYPRPQMRRDSYFCLNGEWKLNGSAIQVPFPPQSVLSGYTKAVGGHLRYETHFSLPQGFCKSRVLLHFGAVDQIAAVTLNGALLARHTGGYLPFSVDITDAVFLQQENSLCVQVTDTLSHQYPYGKQRKNRGGMWYTPVSGIWQTVWLESVPEHAIRSLKITPDLEGITLETDTDAAEYTVRIPLENTELCQICHEKTVRIQLRGVPCAHGAYEPTLWTPENPHLYAMTVTAGEDTVHSYFALRTVTVQNVAERPRICLNGQPVFLHGVLDQGYFSDGIFLPASAATYEQDILHMKELGFNLLRKHVKIEPDFFYAACDRLGMLVFQDMVNNGRYSFLGDTVLPTCGLQRRCDSLPSPGKKRRAFFEQHCVETLAQLYNHPCVVGYTVFNEGWGQFESDRLCARLKQLDSTRFYDATSGWFAQHGSDVDSRHVYFQDTPLQAATLPLLLSECGGIPCPVAGHSFSKNTRYGYGGCADPTALTDEILALYRRMVLPSVQAGLCGCIYTQLSDVEDEINGLYTYDRKVLKVDSEKLRCLRQELDAALQACIAAASVHMS